MGAVLRRITRCSAAMAWSAGRLDTMADATMYARCESQLSTRSSPIPATMVIRTIGTFDAQHDMDAAAGKTDDAPADDDRFDFDLPMQRRAHAMR